MLYEIADANGTTVGELTGTRRRYSTVKLPERSARALGLEDGESVLTIEHHDEGLSSTEIPFIQALWDIKNDDQESKGNK